MLRPQVFALSQGEVQIGLICSEKQAIDATLRSLATLAAHKAELADSLARARDCAPASIFGDVRMLLAAVRAEAQATAMLATAATAAVRALLGIEHTGYDRRARRTQAQNPRLLATY